MTTIKLEYPVQDNGQIIEKLTLRRPTVADQLAVDNLSAAMSEITLLANLAEVSPEVVKKLDLADYKKLQDGFTGFLSPRQN